MQHFNGVVWSTPLGLPRPCGICIHQHSTSGIRKKKEELKQEGDTPHIDTWRNARVWVDFFDGLHS